jgi:ribose transport system ATP-binding protein
VTLLRADAIRKSFGATVALDGVDFAVAAGEVHALIGENGAGKSTLMKILAGAHRADAGAITIDGRPFAPRNPIEARAAGVAMIYQELTLASHLTVEQNVVLGHEPRALGWVRRRAMREAALASLAELGRSDLAPGRRVGELSPGDQQIVEIARALGLGARILVLDEPTSSLTRRDVTNLFAVIRKLAKGGVGVVYISHFLDEIREIADRFTVLRDGRAGGSGRVSETPTETIIEMMVGRRLAELYPRIPRSPGAVVLRHGAFDLRAGEVFGIAGLVGAGRTEFLRGLVARGHGIGLLSEDRKGEGLALGLPIDVNVTLSKLGPVSRLGWISFAKRAAAARRWMEKLAVRARGPSQRVGDLSGGNQQKVALARLLHHDVDVLLLDEPTRGIDVGSKAEIYRLIGELAARGKAVVFVSSYLPELLGVCDRIAVMRRGKLGAAKEASAWTEESLLAEATLGAAEGGHAA